jgi:hypothetical protein
VNDGGSVAVGDGVLACQRQPETAQDKTNETAMILQALPRYDTEFRGFSEFGAMYSVNPFDSLSYPPNSHLTTLNSKTTIL